MIEIFGAAGVATITALLPTAALCHGISQETMTGDRPRPLLHQRQSEGPRIHPSCWVGIAAPIAHGNSVVAGLAQPTRGFTRGIIGPYYTHQPTPPIIDVRFGIEGRDARIFDAQRMDSFPALLKL